MKNKLNNLNQLHKSYAMLHVAVILFGLTAILGSLIDLSAIVMVWWRVLITSISLVLLPVVYKELKTISKKDFFLFVGIGSIVALHWITFYGAIKLANASIALVCFAVVPFFTALLEPFFFKNKKVDQQDIIASVLIVPGMIFVVSDLSNAYITGIITGLFSASLVAVFSIMTKKNIEKANPITISFINMFGALITITILLPFVFMYGKNLQLMPSQEDWVYLLILSILCTSVAYVLATIALQHVPVFSSNLIVNLEPVYGILMAAVFLADGSQLTQSFYIGTSILFIVALGYPAYKTYKTLKENKSKNS